MAKIEGLKCGFYGLPLAAAPVDAMHGEHRAFELNSAEASAADDA